MGLLFGIFLFQGSIQQFVVVFTSPRPSHVVFASPGNYLHQAVSCLVHLNKLLVLVGLILHYFLRYEFIVSKDCEKQSRATLFLSLALS